MKSVLLRIAGVNIPQNKRLVIALTYVYGIGLSSAQAICDTLKISQDRRVNSSVDSEVIALRELIEKKYLVEGELRSQVMRNINNKKSIKCYQGRRHILRLPVRGQRTHSNARTRKGKAIAIAGKKKVR